MWDEQRGRCYLCREPMDPAKAVIDHDHNHCPQNTSCSRCRRGLACHPCNVLIGLARDDPDRLELIAANLRGVKAEARDRISGKPVQAELPINVTPIRVAAGQ